MKAKQPTEETIDRRLRSLGLAGFSAALLEALAPVASIGAQLAYVLDPFVSTGGRQGWLAGLAGILERPERLDGLIERLRDEPE